MAQPDLLIGPYRVLGSLGAGGMAVVYRAQHVESSQFAAVKTVQVPNPHRLASIRREIQALTRIRHPGVVRVVADGIQAGRPWYAMDLVEGETLRSFLARRWGYAHDPQSHTRETSGVATESAGGESGDFSALSIADDLLPSARDGLPEILRIFSHLCATLAFLHGEGIINCDLKPENVLLLAHQEPLIIDFGLTSTFGSADGREALESARGLEGTVAYMSPEQIRNEFVDPRADLYSVGCMLYEAVTGAVPFTGTQGQVLHQHLHESPRAPSDFVRDLPRALEDLILGLLKKPLHERIGYADDVSLTLREMSREPARLPASPLPRPYLYRPRFSGRREALARVSSYIERSKEGRGTFILAGGEGGVGKTRFAMEVTHSSRRSRLRVVTGQCFAGPSATGGAGGSGALHPLRPLLQAIADRCQQGGRELTDRILGERGRLLTLYEPALSHAPGQDEQPAPTPMLAEAGRRRVLSSLVETIGAFASDRPLLVILDDLQWADELTMAFLGSLSAAFMEKTPLVLLGTYRTEQITPELRLLGRADHVVPLMLERLDREAVQAIVRDMLAAAKPPPAGLIDFLTQQSEGNPFFVAEYLRTAMASGAIRRNTLGSWQLADVEDGSASYELLPLPSSLRDLISSRLHGLPAGQAAIVDAAAVIGHDMEDLMLLRVAGVTDSAGNESLDELVNRQILEPVPDGGLRFVHDKVREVAYGAIAHARLPGLHASAAAAIEDSRRSRPDFNLCWPSLGHHFALAGAADRAVDYLSRAANNARAMHANDESVALYRAAIAQLDGLWGTPANQAEIRHQWAGRLHESLADILALTSHREDARAAYDEALARTPEGDAVSRARLYRKRGKTWETEHRHEEALRHYSLARSALAVAPLNASSQQHAEWIQVHVEQLWVYYWLNKVSEMNALIEILRPLIETDATPLQRARFFECQMLLSFRRDRYLVTERTLGFAKAAVDACKDGDELSELPAAQLIYGLALLVYGDIEGAGSELYPILAFAQRAGDGLLQVRCLTYLTLAARMRGQVAEVREYARRTAEAADVSGMLEYLAAARANYAWLSLRQGDLDATIAQAQEALSFWQNRVFPFQWMALLPLLEAQLSKGNDLEATVCAKALLAPSQQYLPGAAADALARAVRSSIDRDEVAVRSSLRLALRELESTGYR